MGLPEEPIGAGGVVALEEDEPEWEAPPSAEHEGYSMAGAGESLWEILNAVHLVCVALDSKEVRVVVANCRRQQLSRL